MCRHRRTLQVRSAETDADRHRISDGIIRGRYFDTIVVSRVRDTAVCDDTATADLAILFAITIPRSITILMTIIVTCILFICTCNRFLAHSYVFNDFRTVCLITNSGTWYDTIRYDMTILTCAQKQTSSQLSLPHGLSLIHI